MLQHGAAEPLHQRADDLAAQRQRIDGAADVLHHHVVDDPHLAELGVDRDMRGVRAEAVGVLLVEERAFGGEPGEFAQRERLAAGPLTLSSPIFTSLGSQPSFFAPASRIAAWNFSVASSSAEPPITIEREWYAP